MFRLVMICLFALAICLPCSAYCPSCHQHAQGVGGINGGPFYPNGFHATANSSQASDRPHPIKNLIAKIHDRLHPASATEGTQAEASCATEPSCGCPAEGAAPETKAAPKSSDTIVDPSRPPGEK